MPPLSVTSDWNSGEKASSLPTSASGTLIGQRADRHVLGHFLEAGLAGDVLHVQRLGVARDAVIDPPVVLGRRADHRSPPLMRDGVGQQAVVDLRIEGVRGDGGDFRRPGRRHRVVRQLNHVQRAAERRSERRGEEEELFDRGVGVLLRDCLVFRGGVNGDVQATFAALGLLVLADQDGARKARPVS